MSAQTPPAANAIQPKSAAAKRATLAIVGRPNVGKSTLFNRLTGRRSALVSDLPGLTRDRREGEADIDGHKVTLVDTAGLEEAASGSIAARMRAQSETAIDAADLILFVIDARAGITPADKNFAERARVSGKPVILVANKCEGRGGKDGFYDAFRLGLGEPIAVSAEHGEGISDLVGDILAALGLKAVVVPKRRRRGDDTPANVLDADGNPIDDEPETPTDGPRAIRVAIVGRPNAGKSTLVNTIIGEDRMITGPEPGLTRDAVATDIVLAGRPVRLFDTAGLRRKVRITETAEKLSASDAVRAIRFAEVVVLLIDAEHPLEQQDLTIAGLALEDGRALVVAVNKWDLVVDKQKRTTELRELLAQSLTDVAGIPLITLSARSGRGIDKLEAAIFKAHDLWNSRVPTAALNRWLADAMQRHTAPASKGRRIKIRYVTQPSTRPPTFVAFCSHSGGLPKSYMRYLINSLRENFNLPGVPIRFNLRKSENPYAD